MGVNQVINTCGSHTHIFTVNSSNIHISNITMFFFLFFFFFLFKEEAL